MSEVLVRYFCRRDTSLKMKRYLNFLIHKNVLRYYRQRCKIGDDDMLEKTKQIER